jgi:hypothetical protein
MSTRLSIAMLMGGLAATVLFGVGATIVLSVPSLAEHAQILLPIVICLSFGLRPFALLGNRAKTASTVFAAS